MNDIFNLAAIAHRTDSGNAVDRLLAAVAEALMASGHQLAGSIQINHERPGRRRCDMTLRDLRTGRLIRISEDRGPSARGCHLDHGALLEAVGLASIGLTEGADMLVVNKFSKREAEGRGFRAIIEDAADRGVPVLTTVNGEHLPMWQEFCGGLSPILETDAVAVHGWCKAALARTHCLSNSVRTPGANAKPARANCSIVRESGR